MCARSDEVEPDCRSEGYFGGARLPNGPPIDQRTWRNPEQAMNKADKRAEPLVYREPRLGTFKGLTTTFGGAPQGLRSHHWFFGSLAPPKQGLANLHQKLVASVDGRRID